MMRLQHDSLLRFSAINVAAYRRPDKFANHFELQLKLTSTDRLQGADKTELTRIRFEPGSETPITVYAQPNAEKHGHWVPKFSPHKLGVILNKLKDEALHFTRNLRNLITQGRPAQQAELPEVPAIGLEAATADIRDIAGEMLQGLD